jgi:hydrogenase maturation factor
VSHEPAPAASPIPAASCPTHCITCGDDGTEMRVLRFDDARALALCVDPDGAHSTVETALVEGVGPGARLLVHAGTAIACLDSAPEESR